MSRTILLAGLLAMTLTSAGTAQADPWKDESGHGRHGHHYHGGGEYQEEFWDGHCKVERKWEKGGEYKEERKCARMPGPVIAAPPPFVFRGEPRPLAPRNAPSQPTVDDHPWLREAPTPSPRVQPLAPPPSMPPEMEAPSGRWENPH